MVDLFVACPTCMQDQAEKLTSDVASGVEILVDTSTAGNRIYG